MPALSAARAERGRAGASAATPVSLRKSRRRMIMRCFRASKSALAYLERFPGFFFACRLEDRSFGKRLGFLRGRYGLVEIAGLGGLFRSCKSGRCRGPLIAQGEGFLVGGLRSGIGGLEIGFRA